MTASSSVATEAKAQSLSLENTALAFHLKSEKELRRMLFLFRLINSRVITALGSSMTRLPWIWHLPIESFVRNVIFNQFCGGTSLHDCYPVIEIFKRSGIEIMLDYAVEGKKTDEDFDYTVAEILNIINYARQYTAITSTSVKITALAQFDLLEKISAGRSLTSDEQSAWEKVQQRLHTICTAAAQNTIHLLIDAEESWIQPAIDSLTESVMQQYNRDKAVVFNTVQLYRTDRLAYLKKCFEHAQQHGYRLGIKLVRGAYMDKERKRAKKLGYPSPIHSSKSDTDSHYNEAITFCITHIDTLDVYIATHNEDSIYHAIGLMQKHSLKNNHSSIHFAQLYGMSDHITYNLAQAGYRVSKYVPYGPVREVISYLIRRAEENTSVRGQMSRELQLIRKELQRRALLKQSIDAG